jgi:hypothetical protein
VIARNRASSSWRNGRSTARSEPCSDLSRARKSSSRSRAVRHASPAACSTPRISSFACSRFRRHESEPPLLSRVMSSCAGSLEMTPREMDTAETGCTPPCREAQAPSRRSRPQSSTMALRPSAYLRRSFTRPLCTMTTLSAATPWRMSTVPGLTCSVGNTPKRALHDTSSGVAAGRLSAIREKVTRNFGTRAHRALGGSQHPGSGWRDSASPGGILQPPTGGGWTAVGERRGIPCQLPRESRVTR